MQTLYISGTDKELKVVRSFSKGVNDIQVFQTVDGRFCYASGKSVDRKDHLEFLPEPHKAKALEWFRKTYPEQIVRVAKTDIGDQNGSQSVS